MAEALDTVSAVVVVAVAETLEEVVKASENEGRDIVFAYLRHGFAFRSLKPLCEW